MLLNTVLLRYPTASTDIPTLLEHESERTGDLDAIRHNPVALRGGMGIWQRQDCTRVGAVQLLLDGI